MHDDEAKRAADDRRADEALLRELAGLIERDDPVPEKARGGARREPGARRRDRPPSDDDDGE